MLCLPLISDKSIRKEKGKTLAMTGGDDSVNERSQVNPLRSGDTRDKEVFGSWVVLP